jgi:hypothetical protein
MYTLYFIAPDEIHKPVYLDEMDFAVAITSEAIQPAFAEIQLNSHANVVNLMLFLFGKDVVPEVIISNAHTEVMDLTAFRGQCLTAAEAENRYKDWLALSGRENTQNEFADLVCVAGFIHRNIHKKYLLLRVSAPPGISEPSAPVYPQLQVTITRFISKDNPYFIECRFTDALGKEHIIHEKVPVITHEDLDEHSTYPRPGFIACEVMEQFPADGGSEIVLIDTSKPWSIETTEGETIFEVDAAQVIIP